MVFTEMISFVRVRVDDTRSVRFSDDVIAAELNEQIQVVADDVELMSHYPQFSSGVVTVTLTGTTIQYALPADFDTDRRVIRTDMSTPYPCHKINWNESPEWSARGTPFGYSGELLYYFATDSTTDLPVFCIPYAPQITATVQIDYLKLINAYLKTDNTSRIAIPRRFHILPCLLAARALAGADNARRDALNEEIGMNRTRLLQRLSFDAQPGEVYDGSYAP